MGWCLEKKKMKLWSIRSANSTFRKHVLRVNSLQILSDYILNASIKILCAPVSWVKLAEMIHKKAPRRENNEKPPYYCYDAQKGWPGLCGLSLCATFLALLLLLLRLIWKTGGGKQFPVSARYRLLLPLFIFSIAAKLQQWKQPNAQSQHY